jgi:hypothetical protein
LGEAMLALTELRLIIVLIAMFTLPGWALLTVNDSWRQWRGLQRWVVAVGISIACYPVLFYGTRSSFLFLTMGRYKMGALLLACAAVVGWRMRRHWKEQFKFGWLEWVAIGVFGLTLFTRFWIIRDHPYPAWSDSLHHTLLTQLTAVQGKLPTSLEPYFPIPLDQYHLGLYSLSATVQGLALWNCAYSTGLAQVPAHTALLWTAQVLNGLCGLGVYLVLDRKVGRVGAIVGAAVVGLLSHQPAFYVNWGRFTQLASQTILLIAWLVTWEAVATWKLPWQEHKVKILWHTVCAALLTGAVFLLHFRVAIFYVPLLVMSVIWELWKARKTKRVASVVLRTIAVGTVALLVVMPALWGATRIYVSTRLSPTSSDQSITVDEVSETIQHYFEFLWGSVPYLAARTWLMVLSAFSIAVGLLRRNKLVIASLLWTLVLYLLGNAYLLGLPLLSFTNLGAVLVMLYLPIGLVVGSAAEEAVALCGPRWRERAAWLVIALVLVAGLVASRVRVTETEPYRYFVTPEDVAAMDWIKENTPPDALFAVNTHFWLPRAPHGTDAGYWIPYFTGRQTTAGAMLLNLGGSDDESRIVALSRLVEQLEVDNASLTDLQAMGVDYVYIGRRGDFSGPGLNPAQLSQSENVKVLYQEGGVYILQIESPDSLLTSTPTSDPNWTPTATSTLTPTATPYRIYLPLVFKQFDPTQPSNLLRNPGFEEGFSERGAGEVTVANAWEPWWVQGSEEQTSQGYLVRPEYKPEDAWVFTTRRVHSGRFSQKYFSTYSTHIAGIYQQVAVARGSLVTFSIWVQVWSSTEPDQDQCEGFGNHAVSAGIDPYGGNDGTSGNIVWSDPVMSCNEWVHLSVSTVAQADTVTVFTRGAPESRVHFNDSYWDDAVLTGSLPQPGPAH